MPAYAEQNCAALSNSASYFLAQEPMQIFCAFGNGPRVYNAFFFGGGGCPIVIFVMHSARMLGFAREGGFVAPCVSVRDDRHVTATEWNQCCVGCGGVCRRRRRR